VTQPGDLIILGTHRLLCGDSGNPEDVARLLDRQPIHLVHMDPPYNVRVEPRSNNAIAAAIADGRRQKNDQRLARASGGVAEWEPLLTILGDTYTRASLYSSARWSCKHLMGSVMILDLTSPWTSRCRNQSRRRPS
jgi:DNA modification methylase